MAKKQVYQLVDTSLKDKHKYRIFLYVFILAFLWQLFFTWGFNFFFEDLDFYRLYEDAPQGISGRLVEISRIGADFIKDFFKTGRLFKIGFNSLSADDRPFQFHTYHLLKVLFNDNVLMYRISKAAVFAFNTTLIFIILNQVSTLLSICGGLLYMTSSEIWLSVVYLSDVGPFVQGAIILCVLLFIRLLGMNSVRDKKFFIYYCLIILLSNYAVLAKTDGRYLGTIFLLTILFFRRQQIKYHIVPLVILVLLELPVLGLLKKIFLAHDFIPINLLSHPDSPPFSEAFKLAFENRKFAINALGVMPIVCLLFVVIVHCSLVVMRYMRAEKNNSLQDDALIRGRLFLFSLWFLATFCMMVLARGFVYDGEYNFQLFDLSFFIAPLILLALYYIYYVGSKVDLRYRKVYLGVIVSLILSQVLFFNTVRINKFRGGWGNYFCAWDNAEKYINGHSNHSLTLAFTEMAYKPFIFRHSNNTVMNTRNECGQSEFCDVGFIEKEFQKNNYDKIFVLSRKDLKFRATSDKVKLVGIEKIGGDSGDLYDSIKKLIKRPSIKVIKIYQFQPEKKH